MRLVKPKKFLGQHFLKDLKVAQDIADTVDACPALPILEVGPGMGVLTQFLLPKERPVKVVEVDYESVAYLREAYPQLEDDIIEDDFLKMNLRRVFDGNPFVLTGNYPYNISSQIFFKMLDNKDLIPCCTGMIQKEVAERIAAGPGSKTYGILSVLIQAWYDVEYLFTVHEHVFNPPPKVKSAVIRMTRNEEYIDKVKSLIEQKDADNVKVLLADLHPADIAELCNDLEPEKARFVYRLLDNETAADVLVEMDEDVRKEFLELLPSETIAKKFVDYMDTDDAVDLMRDLDEDKQEEVLSHIEDIEQAGDIVDLLKYDEDTAGGLMGTEMVTVNENWSMPECLKEMRLQAEQLDEIYYVYVIDDDERLQGVFPLKKMITSPSVSKVKHVMKKDPISVHVDTPIDEVVQIIEKYDLVAVPVVDSIGRLVRTRLPVGFGSFARRRNRRQPCTPNQRPPALAAHRHAGRYRQLHDIGQLRRHLCRTPRNGPLHPPDRWYGRKRRYTVVRHHRPTAHSTPKTP